MTLKGFSERLNRAIGKSGLSICRIADKLNTSRRTIYCWLDGDALPNSFSLVKLCNILDVSADYLLFGKEK